MATREKGRKREERRDKDEDMETEKRKKAGYSSSELLFPFNCRTPYQKHHFSPSIFPASVSHITAEMYHIQWDRYSQSTAVT